MAGYNRTAQLRKAYLLQNRNDIEENPPQANSSPLSPLLPYIENTHLKDDLNDMALAMHGNNPIILDHLAERVFGNQLARDRLTASHVGHLLQERSLLYHNHMKDIRRRINQVGNRISSLSRPYTIRTPQQVAGFERLRLQLESDERKEQLAFWKDTAELRDKLLDTSINYRATLDRASLLGPEGGLDE